MAANAIAFVWVVASPVLRADDWFFVNLIARPAFNGTLSLGSFFAHRGNLDHSLVLLKLGFLAELRWFHLDCKPEAIIGVSCAVGCALALRPIFGSKLSVEVPENIRALGWMTATALLFSLNSTAIWKWPPAALDYCSVTLVALLFLLSAWRALDTGRVFLLAATAVLYAIVADHTALIAAFALLIILAILRARQLMRGRLRRVLVAGVLVAAATQMTIRYLAPTVRAGRKVAVLGPVWRQLLGGEWWKWIAFPLSNSIVAPEHLAGPLQQFRLGWQIAVALLLLVAHSWFWRHFVSAPVNRATFSAAFLMLYFYGLVASIVLGRASMFGADYLNQPRYVFFYQFNLIALAIMLVTRYRPESGNVGRRLAVGLAGALLLLQIPLAAVAWQSAPAIHGYQVRMAEQIVAMGSNPMVTPPHCAPELLPCGYRVAQRREVIGFLQEHHLNVYSREFRLTHGYPSLESPTREHGQTR